MKKYLVLLTFLLAQVGYGQTSSTGSITTNASNCFTTNACVVLNLPQSVGFFPSSTSVTVSGSWTGTLTFEASGDNGVSWPAITGNPLPSGAGVTTTTANGTWQFVVVGLTNFRVRGSAAMTNTAVVTIQSSPAVAVTGSQGLVPISQGGTGATTASAGFAALAPAGTAGQCLTFVSGAWQAGNCSVGGYPVANVVTDSPGTAYTGGGTITFTQGSSTVSTSNAWPSSAIGTILQYNSGTNPNFRTVVTAVSPSQIVVSSPFPAAGTTPTYSAGLGSGTWNDVADACAQMNASILNHPGSVIDARGLTGNAVTCTINPFSGATNQGGELLLGRVKIVTARTWGIPTRWHLRGVGRGDSSAVNSNTTLQADSVNFPTANYSVVGAISTGVSTATNSATFTDTGAGGGGSNASAFQVAVTNPACDTGAYGHLTVASALPGWVEGQMITFQSFTNFTGTVNTVGTAVTLASGSNFVTGTAWNGLTITINSVAFTIASVQSSTALTLTTSAGTQGPVNYSVTGTGWNGNWTVAGISGTSVEVFFGNEQTQTCPNPGTGSPVADPDTLGLLQAQQAVTVTGTLTSAAVVNASGVAAQTFIQVTDTVAEFAAGQVGNCSINTTSPSKSYTITDFVSTTVVNIFTGGDGNPSWAGKAFTMVCWEQGYVQATASATTLTLNSKAAFALLNGTSTTYNISAPVVGILGYGFSAYASSLENMLVDCNGTVDCNGVFDFNGQENSRVEWVTVTKDSGVGFLFGNSAGNSGPHQGLEVFAGGPAANTQIPPVIGIQEWMNGLSQNAGVDRCTIIGDIRWWAGVSIDGAGYVKGCHTESVVNGFNIGKFADANNGSLGRGALIYEYYGGVNQYNDVRIENSGNMDVDIRGLTVSNAAAHDTIEDLSIGQDCTVSNVSDVHTTQSKPSLAFYTMGHDAYGFRTRLTSEAGPATGSANQGGQVSNCGGAISLGATYGVMKAQNQVVKLTANTAAITATTLATATPFLTWTGPAGTNAGNVAGQAFINASATGAYNWTFDCHGVYSQATAAAANLWGLAVTGGSFTRLDANGVVYTSLALAGTSGATTNYTTLTTPVQLVSATPSAFGAVGTLADMFPFHFWGVLQQAGGATPPTLNVIVATGAAADAVTVYAGSMCTVW